METIKLKKGERQLAIQLAQIKKAQSILSGMERGLNKKLNLKGLVEGREAIIKAGALELFRNVAPKGTEKFDKKILQEKYPKIERECFRPYNDGEGYRLMLNDAAVETIDGSIIESLMDLVA